MAKTKAAQFDLANLEGQEIRHVRKLQGSPEGQEYVNDILQIDLSHTTLLVYTSLDRGNPTLIFREVPALFTCPFCGSNNIEVKPWHGGGPDKHMVACDGDDCAVLPSVTGETLEGAVATWNQRA